jgi:hypothetical protein
MSMKRSSFVLISLLLTLASLIAFGQEMKYPPLSAFMMPRDAEIALAESAAPLSISDHATVKVFTQNGYEVAHEGDNGFVCFVMRIRRR